MFVFHQGLIGRHVFFVCLFCSLSDALLIYLGYSGISLVLNESKNLQKILLFSGCVWLSIYGLFKIRDGIHIGNNDTFDTISKTNLKWGLPRTLIAVAGITWLNPHVYLDTVLLIGSITNTIEATKQVYFLIGTISASFIFFFLLGYAGNKLGSKFKNPSLWRKLNIVLGLIMLFIAFHLGLSGIYV